MVWNLGLTFTELQGVMVTVMSGQVAVCPVGPGRSVSTKCH